MIKKINWDDTSYMLASYETKKHAHEMAQLTGDMIYLNVNRNDDSLVTAGLIKFLRREGGGWVRNTIAETCIGGEEYMTAFVWGPKVQGLTADKFLASIIDTAEPYIDKLEEQKGQKAWEDFCARHFLDKGNEEARENFMDFIYNEGSVGYYAVKYDDAAALNAVTKKENAKAEEGQLW